MTIEKFNLNSQDIRKEQIERLMALFPEMVTEGRVDFDKLKQTLGEEVDSSKERFGMSWAGKSNCFRIIQDPSTGTLNPMRDESVDFDTSNNIFIEGENLEVLKLLQKAYYGKIKTIYIDPPYNTGNDFVYSDKYGQQLDEYLKLTGQTSEDGKRLTSNTEADGRYHSNWLNMMYPRLFLARNLLSDDGTIFVSIDDNELINLRAICNEIFGENNFLATVVWQKKYAATNDSKGFSTTHDYIVVYTKSDNFNRILLPRTEEQNRPYKYDDGDGKGLWRSDNLLVKSFSTSGVYPIINPNTGKEYWPPSGSCWRASEKTMNTWLKENRIFFGKDGKGAPQLKRYLNEVQQGRVPITWWPFGEVGHNDAANKELSSLFNSKAPFDTPKPTALIKRIISISCEDTNTVLDFFAGSGTTAHAVMNLNKEDGGKRKFICVQLPEPTPEDSEARKAGYETIADIAKERIRRAAQKINEENPDTPIDLGFKVFRLDRSNFKVWDSKTTDVQTALDEFENKVKKEANPEDILYELLLKAGFELTTRIEKKEVAGKEVFSIGGDLLIICLENELTLDLFRELRTLNPDRVIVLDSGFGGNDQLKTNAVQILGKNGDEEYMLRSV